MKGTMASFAYKYGLIPKTQFPKEAIDELYKANKLWNNLAAHNNDNSERYRELINGFSVEANELSQQVQGLETRIKEIRELKNKIRVREKRKNLTTVIPELNSELKSLYENLKLIKASLKDVRARDRAANMSKLQAFYDEDKKSIASLIKSCGCVWSNHELIYTSFDVARKRARKENTSLNFHRFDGSGRWGYRVSGGVKLSELHNEKKALFIQKPDSSQSIQTLALRMRLCDDQYGNMVYMDFDLKYHRPLPNDALIKSVVIKRELIGDRFRHFIIFSLQTEDKVDLHKEDGQAVGIDVGFIRTERGLRIATTWDGKQHTTLQLSPEYLSRIDRCDQLHSQIQDSANFLAAQIQPLMQEYQSDDTLSISKSIKYFKSLNLDKKSFSHYNLRRFALANRHNPTLFPGDVSALLEDWYKQKYLRNFREMNNLKKKLMNQREHLYRNWSAKIAASYDRVVIEDLNLQQIAQVKDKDEVLTTAVRGDRKIASLYSLILALSNACKQRNGCLIKKQSTYTTSMCSECYTNNIVNGRHFVCSRCGTVHEQDENAAKNLYAMDVNKVESMSSLASLRNEIN